MRIGVVAGTGSLRAFTAGVGEFIGEDVAAARTIAAGLGVELGVLGAVVRAGVSA